MAGPVSGFAYPVALAAAAAFAVAIPLEHRAADRAPDAGGLSSRQVVSFVRAIVRDGWWLAAMALNTVGFGGHALALHLGGLTVVQPLLVAGLVFAPPVNHWLRREPIRSTELVCAGALVVGLSGFLLIASPGDTTAEPADRGPAVAPPSSRSWSSAR